MGRKPIDLINKRFGRLDVISRSHKDKWGNVYWECVCDCGGGTITTTGNLKSGRTRSCGCLQKELSSKRMKGKTGKLSPCWGKNDITGQKFGRLTVIEQTDKRHNGHIVCLCKCECDNFVEVVRPSLLRHDTKSCGCLHKEIMTARTGKLHQGWNPDITDEERRVRRSYPEYKAWRKAVLKRDDYTCVKCGKRGGKLNAHHIEGYANNKELRTSIDNGITLCKKHHAKLHDIYGYDVGSKHLAEFIENNDDIEHVNLKGVE